MGKAKWVAADFVSTEFTSAEEKARFANRFARFVDSGFRETLFTQKFYRQVSNCFGHIAHYNRGGFWETWFSTPQQRADFLQVCADWPCYGDPAYTFSDVERKLAAWITANGLAKIWRGYAEAAQQGRERSALRDLAARYPDEVRKLAAAS